MTTKKSDKKKATNALYDRKDYTYCTVPKLLIHSPALSPTAFRILTLLLCYKTPFFSYSGISERTGIRSTRTIKKAIDELVGYGIVQYKPGYSGYSNTYAIAHWKKWKLPDVQDLEGDPDLEKFILDGDGAG